MTETQSAFGRKAGDRIDDMVEARAGTLATECAKAAADGFPSGPRRSKAESASIASSHCTEASTSRIGEDQLFYCMQRGIAPEEAVSMIVSGFCKAVFQNLPMEFAVEAQKLLGVSLEGSTG